MENNQDDKPKSNYITSSNTSYDNWDLTKSSDCKSNDGVNTNHKDWNLVNDKLNNPIPNEYGDNCTDYCEQTLTDVQISNNSANTYYDECSLPETNNLGYQNNIEINSENACQKPLYDSWGDPISSTDHYDYDEWNQHEADGQHNQYEEQPYIENMANTIENDSWENQITPNNDYKVGNTGYNGRDLEQGRSYNRNSNYANVNTKSETEKPKITKSTYIPPELEIDDNSTLKAGLNFEEKYDKIKVTVTGMDVPKHISTFQNAGLRNILINNLTKCHYNVPTPIQKYALPIIMNGRDMIASAQTGSGKTAAFLLPILDNLLSDPSELIVDGNHCEPQAVILSPTRELAIQICEVALRLSRDTQIKCELLYGGTSTYHQKMKILRGVHIIVATPGRLLGFVNSGLISFSSLRFFVLDEADRMLDMGFQLDVERILNNNTMVSSGERSTIMFSATLPESVQQIAKSYLKSDYVSIAVGENGESCKDVIQTIIQVTKFNKKTKLLELLKNTDDCQGTIVFVEHKRNADFIAAFLSELDFPTTSIHGDREQSERELALKDFKTKRMKILVATAVAARGLDIIGVTMVVNFDLPKTINEYVHRIGRTGRMGNSGKAVSFFDPSSDEDIAPYLVNNLKQADQQIPEFLSHYNGINSAGNYNQFNDIRTDVTVASNVVEEVW